MLLASIPATSIGFERFKFLSITLPFYCLKLLQHMTLRWRITVASLLARNLACRIHSRSHEKLVLRLAQRHYRESSLPHQRRIAKQFLRLDLSQALRSFDRLSRLDLH